MNFTNALFVFPVRRIGQSIVLFMVHKLNIKYHFVCTRDTSRVFIILFGEGKGLYIYRRVKRQRHCTRPRFIHSTYLRFYLAKPIAYVNEGNVASVITYGAEITIIVPAHVYMNIRERTSNQLSSLLPVVTYSFDPHAALSHFPQRSYVGGKRKNSSLRRSPAFNLSPFIVELYSPRAPRALLKH